MPDVTLRRGRAKRADVRLWRTRYTPSATVVTGGSAVNPATQSLRGYWRASYSAAPWVGTSSAGASASYDLATAGSDPTSGTAVNGFTPADFDGAFDYLIGAGTGGGAATNFEDHVSVGAGTISVLVKADTAATDAGAGLRIDNPGIVAEDTGSTCFTLGFSTAGATVAFFDTGATYKELTVAASTGQWLLVQCKWDGSALRMRVNNGAWQSIACADLFNGALGWNVGKNYNVGYFDGQVLELHTAQSALADATLDGIAIHLQNRYGLSLGFSSSSYTIPNTTVHPVLSRGYIREGTANADVYMYRDPDYVPVVNPGDPYLELAIHPDRPRFTPVIRTTLDTVVPITAGTPVAPADFVEWVVFPDRAQARGRRFPDEFVVPITADAAVVDRLPSVVFPDRGRLTGRETLPYVVGPIEPDAAAPSVGFDLVVGPERGRRSAYARTPYAVIPQAEAVFDLTVHPDAPRRPSWRRTPVEVAPAPAAGFGAFDLAIHPDRAQYRRATHVAPFAAPITAGTAPVVVDVVWEGEAAVSLLSARHSPVSWMTATDGEVSTLVPRSSVVVVLDAQAGTVRAGATGGARVRGKR